MEQQNDSSVNTNDAAVAAALLPGTMLREARERLGLSVADAADQTKLAPRQIEALEADDYANLPEMAFVRGFVRSYAKILQLDPQPLLAMLPQAIVSGAAQVTRSSVEVPFPDAHSPRVQNLIWLGAALVLAVMVVVFAVWHYTSPRSQAEPEKTHPVELAIALPADATIVAASDVAETVVGSAVAPSEPTPPAKPATPSVATAVPAQPVAQSVAVPAVKSVQPAAVSAVKVTQPVSSSVIKPVPSVTMPATKPLASVVVPAVKAVAPVSAVKATQPVAVAPAKPVAPVAVPAVKPVTPVSAVKAAPVISAPATPKVAGASPSTVVRLAFEAESWAEVRDAKGNIVSSQINPAGSELNLQGQGPFSLVVGHASTSRLFHKGKQINLVPYTHGSSDVARLTLE